MRIKLTLRPTEQNSLIPINYQYPLSAAIYRMLEAASSDYATQLHERGYLSPTGKLMKLFVFSRLYIEKMRPSGSFLMACGFSPCSLCISSPVLDFMENLVGGLFAEQQIAIGNSRAVARFQVERFESLEPPDLPQLAADSPTHEIHFRASSPINVSLPRSEMGLPSEYLRPDDPAWPKAIHRNLLHKFTTIYGRTPVSEELTFLWDDEAIQRSGGFDRISKLISIKEGDEYRETKVKAFIAPFYLGGSLDLIHCAYECGLGDKNSLGFGMIDVA